jgi:hypothetical protein
VLLSNVEHRVFGFNCAKKTTWLGEVLTPLILATQEVEIRRMEVPGQPRKKVHETHFNQ